MARPRRLDPAELQSQIIQTARDLLKDSEAGALTARGLAAELKIPASAIYRIFPNMSDVIMAVNRQTFAELELLFDRLPETADARARLIALCQGYMGFMQGNPNLWRALFEGRRMRSSFPEWYGQAIAGLMGRLAALLQATCPGLALAEAREHAERLYVLTHGAISLGLDGRLALITPLGAQDIAIGAINSVVDQLRAKAG